MLCKKEKLLWAFTQVKFIPRLSNLRVHKLYIQNKLPK